MISDAHDCLSTGFELARDWLNTRKNSIDLTDDDVSDELGMGFGGLLRLRAE